LVPLKKSKIQAVFFHSCCNWKYIQIENNILWKTHFDQNIIRDCGIFLLDDRNYQLVLPHQKPW
jgi:hypothetical protein